MTEPVRLRELVAWVDREEATHRRLVWSLALSLAATGATALSATDGNVPLTDGYGAFALAAWVVVLAASRRLRADHRGYLHGCLFVLGGVALLVTTLYGLARGIYPSALFEDAGYTVCALTAATLLAVVGAGFLGEAIGAWVTLRRDPADPEEIVARVLDD